MLLDKVQSVYVMRNTDIDIIKIGISCNTAERRTALQSCTGCKIDLLYVSDPMTNAIMIESNTHKQFNDCRRYGEWFNLSPDIAIKYIESLKYLFAVDPILTRYNNNGSITSIAEQYNVSRQAIIKRINKYRECGLIDKSKPDAKEQTEPVNKPISNDNIIQNINNYSRIGTNKYKDEKGAIVTIKYIKGKFMQIDT